MLIPVGHNLRLFRNSLDLFDSNVDWYYLIFDNFVHPDIARITKDDYSFKIQCKKIYVALYEPSASPVLESDVKSTSSDSLANSHGQRQRCWQILHTDVSLLITEAVLSVLLGRRIITIA